MDVKTCTICHETKSLELFGKSKQVKIGRRNQCKVCLNARLRKNFPTEARRQYMAAYRKTESGKTAVKRGMKKWLDGPKSKAYYKRPDVRKKINVKIAKYRIRNPGKTAAREAVKQAKRKGLIPYANTLRCSHCDSKAEHYHHHKGYEPSFHLDVIPLCRPCHFKADT